MIRALIHTILLVSTHHLNGDLPVSGTVRSVNTTWKQTTPNVPGNDVVDTVGRGYSIRPVENEESVVFPIEEADPSLHVDYELLPRKTGVKRANRKGKNAEAGHSSLYRGV